MRFLIFNIVVAGALAFLVMDRPNLELARAIPGEMMIPTAPMTETPVALQPQQHTPVKADPTPALIKPAPQPVAEVPPMPPAEEVPVRTTHKAPYGASEELTQTAERIKDQINERQEKLFGNAPAETAAVEVDTFEKAVNRRKSLMDLASDMELMFAEKMMR